MNIEILINLLTSNWIGVTITLSVVIFLVYHASEILSEQFSLMGDKLKVSPGIKGATFDAIGGSIPELFTAIISLILLGSKGLEIGIGTVSGSAIYNILIIPFLSILFYKKNRIKKISTHDINRDTGFYILALLILFTGIITKNLFFMGVSLLTLYASYIFFLTMQNKIYRVEHRKRIKKKYKKSKSESIKISHILFGLLILYIAIELAIRSIMFIAGELNISYMLISLIGLAILTSAPDTLLGIFASRKGRLDSSLGNAVGSNIFNICIGLGLPITIGFGFMGLDQNINLPTNISLFVFLILSILIFSYILNIKKLYRKHSYYLLFLYLFFIGDLVYATI